MNNFNLYQYLQALSEKEKLSHQTENNNEQIMDIDQYEEEDHELSQQNHNEHSSDSQGEESYEIDEYEEDKYEEDESEENESEEDECEEYERDFYYDPYFKYFPYPQSQYYGPITYQQYVEQLNIKQSLKRTKQPKQYCFNPPSITILPSCQTLIARSGGNRSNSIQYYHQQINNNILRRFNQETLTEMINLFNSATNDGNNKYIVKRLSSLYEEWTMNYINSLYSFNEDEQQRLSTEFKGKMGRLLLDIKNYKDETKRRKNKEIESEFRSTGFMFEFK